MVERDAARPARVDEFSLMERIAMALGQNLKSVDRERYRQAVEE